MEQFNHSNLRVLRETMIKEMEAVAAKHGLFAKFGNIRFTADEFGVKMTVKSAAGIKREAEVKPIVAMGDIKIGTMIKHPARRGLMEIVGFNPNAHKNNVQIRTQRGKVYVCSMEEARKYAVA